MSAEILAKNLLLTERGQKWLDNFDDEHKQSARNLASHLLLVSQTEFERELVRKIELESLRHEGPVALYGVRELNAATQEHIFGSSDDTVNATPLGSDIGSEGRIASMIRNLVRGSKGKLLNHPSICELREKKCSIIFFVDDFIGSGKRVCRYIEDFYRSPTIKSWHSYHLLQTYVLTYSGTPGGLAAVERAKTKPKAFIVRSCPTLKNLLFRKGWIEELIALCKVYAKKNKMNYPMGFGKVGALIVFEHSCPNNCPPILWGSGKNPAWEPLFLEKTVASDVRTVFPAEIARKTPVHILIAAGEKKIARAARRLVGCPMPGTWLATLSLFKKGVRRIDAVEAATGLTHAESVKVVEDCVAAGLLTLKWRLTPYGEQELRASRAVVSSTKKILPNLIEEDYYPSALRRFDVG